MSEPEFDTSPVDAWIGVPLGGGQMKDPIAPNDIRRWAQGMQNPNPLYFDEAFAAQGRFGRLIAPFSFAVCTDDSHGAAPAIQGNIEGTHMLFGGDEWWFFGPRIGPGDKISRDRMLFDYKVTKTGFAGPTMFSRGLEKPGPGFFENEIVVATHGVIGKAQRIHQISRGEHGVAGLITGNIAGGQDELGPNFRKVAP